MGHRKRAKLKFGEFERGSRADYFLKLFKEAKYLSMAVNEQEIIEMIINHFPTDVQRGIVNSGYKNVDDIEKQLWKIDRFEENWENRDLTQNRNRGVRGVLSGSNNNNNNRQINSGWRDNRPGNVNDHKGVKEISGEVATIFSENFEEILEEPMSEIKPVVTLPTVDIDVENVRTVTLIDSGSQITGVSESFLGELIQENGKIPRIPARCTTLMGALGNKEAKVKEQVFLTFTLGNVEFEYPFLVIPGLARNIILGYDWLRDNQVTIDFSNNVLTFESRQDRISFKNEPNKGEGIRVNEILDDEQSSISSKPVLKEYSEKEIREVAENAQCFDEVYKEKLFQLLLNFKDIFSDEPGLMKGYQHEIVMRDDSPFFIKSYPIPHVYRNEVRSQIREMEKWGVIRQCRTEYISPLVVVKKKDGSVRVCIDARYLNGKMEKDHVMPQNPNEIVYNFTSGQVLSTIDLSASYWQVEIKPEHQKYTGFLFEGCSYVFQRLPFGLSTSVGSFIRGLTYVLGCEVEEWSVAYVDDLLIFSESPDVHLRHLRLIFEKFRVGGVTIKLRKSQFARPEVNFLGHIISGDGISIDPKRFDAIKNFPKPRNVKELKSFLGVLNYDSKFCAYFSKIILPLVRLLKKNQAWNWGVQEMEAFEQAKVAFLQATTLKHPDPSNRYYIECDSSGNAMGACLYQIDEEFGSKNYIAFASRTMQPAELRYTITEKEAAAVVFALRKWRIYVLGRPLTIKTDHKALSFLRSCRLLTARLARWTMFI